MRPFLLRPLKGKGSELANEEYKVCAAAVERLDAEEDTTGEGPLVHFTPANAPQMFPYDRGEH